MDDVRKRYDAFLAVVDEMQINLFKQLGEEAVTFARSEHANNWQDQSGNLRSSIGYMIFVDGQPVFAPPFETVSPNNPPKDGVPLDGAKQGEQLCRQIGEQTTDISLVVVAGMNYALYVEAKGRDVLAGAQTYVQRTLPTMIEQLKNDIKNVPM